MSEIPPPSERFQEDKQELVMGKQTSPDSNTQPVGTIERNHREIDHTKLTHLNIVVPLHEPNPGDIPKLQNVAFGETETEREERMSAVLSGDFFYGINESMVDKSAALSDSQFFHIREGEDKYTLECREFYPEGVSEEEAKKHPILLFHGAKPGWSKSGTGDQRASNQEAKDQKKVIESIEGNLYIENPDVVDEPMYIGLMHEAANARGGVGLLIEQRAASVDREMERGKMERIKKLIALKDKEDISEEEKRREAEQIVAQYPLDYRKCSLGARKYDMMGSILSQADTAETIDIIVHSMGAFALAEAVAEMRVIADKSPETEVGRKCKTALEKLKKSTIIQIVPADYARETIDMPPLTNDQPELTDPEKTRLGGINYRGGIWERYPMTELVDNSQLIDQLQDTDIFGKVILIQAGLDEVVKAPYREPQHQAFLERHPGEEPTILVDQNKKTSTEHFENGDTYLIIEGHKHAGMTTEESVVNIVTESLKAA